METGRFAPYAPLAGVAFAVLVVASFILVGETPDLTDSAQKVVDFYDENKDQVLISGLLLAWACVALVWFAGSLRAALRKVEPGEGRLSTVAFGGSLLAATGILCFAGFEFAAADSVNDVPPEVTQTLNVFDNDFFFILAVGLSLLYLATGLSILRYGALPRWLGYLSLLLGVIAVTPVGFAAALAALLWVPLVGILIYLGARSGVAAPPAAPPPA